MNSTNSRNNANRGSGTQRRVGSWLLVALAVGVGGSVGLMQRQAVRAHGARIYTRAGMGGWIAPDKNKAAPDTNSSNDALAGLKADYRAGRWTDVDRKAADLLAAQQYSSNASERRQAGEAELLAAYASAWRKEYKTAAERFAAVQRLAGELPTHGARKTALGEEPQPSLEEEAAFQQAVCMGAEGNKAGAEAEYDAFMQTYPQSILVHAAIKRVTRLHNGDIPKDAEALWTAAMQQQKAKEQRAQREAALCGPECLAELLRRQGKKADIHALAVEMHTSADGSSLQQVAAVAQKHGFAAEGVELTQAGLAQQKMPLIALLKPGHFVLLEQVSEQSVRVWNPDAEGVGRAGTKTYSLTEWQQQWTGVAIRLPGKTQ